MFQNRKMTEAIGTEPGFACHLWQIRGPETINFYVCLSVCNRTIPYMAIIDINIAGYYSLEGLLVTSASNAQLVSRNAKDFGLASSRPKNIPASNKSTFWRRRKRAKLLGVLGKFRGQSRRRSSYFSELCAMDARLPPL